MLGGLFYADGRTLCCAPLPDPIFILLLRKDRPSGRWGLTFTALDNDLALLFGGQGEGPAAASKDACWLYNAASQQWEMLPAADAPPARTGHSACFDPVCSVRTEDGVENGTEVQKAERLHIFFSALINYVRAAASVFFFISGFRTHVSCISWAAPKASGSSAMCMYTMLPAKHGASCR